jgi:hypothetical protein
MLSFAFRGTIADIDETTSDEPCHPATVLIIEIDDSFSRVVVAKSVVGARRELLCAGRPVEVLGEVRDSPGGAHHVATLLRLIGAMH